MSKILIADDHAVTRAGYKQFLEAEPGITLVGEARSGSETLDRLRQETWDLLLLDIHMPDRGGLDILQRVRAGHPNVRILIMSGLPEEQYARNVLRAGASGYLSKSGTCEDLLQAVRLLLRGHRYISAALAESIAADLEASRNSHAPLHADLSAREFQIFCKLAGGASITEIALELSLSIKTISTYRARVLGKMSFSCNADITAYALVNGIIR